MTDFDPKWESITESVPFQVSKWPGLPVNSILYPGF